MDLAFPIEMYKTANAGDALKVISEMKSVLYLGSNISKIIPSGITENIFCITSLYFRKL